MANGWIKLHRQIIENDFLMKDHTSLVIFIYCLCRADKDTGKFTAGRWQLSEALNISGSTIYKALKRLQKHKILTQKSNTRYTEYSILNWDKYQNTVTQGGKNQVKTKEHTTRNKNKDINNIIYELKPKIKSIIESSITTNSKHETIKSLLVSTGMANGLTSIPEYQPYTDSKHRIDCVWVDESKPVVGFEIDQTVYPKSIKKLQDLNCLSVIITFGRNYSKIEEKREPLPKDFIHLYVYSKEQNNEENIVGLKKCIDMLSTKIGL